MKKISRQKTKFVIKESARMIQWQSPNVAVGTLENKYGSGDTLISEQERHLKRKKEDYIFLSAVYILQINKIFKNRA